jgi:hypothetical protein
MLMHLRFKRWDKASFARLLQDWRIFRKCTCAPLFAHAEYDDDKWARFVTHLGFKPVTNFQGADGLKRRVFISLPEEHYASRNHTEQRPHHDHRDAVGSAGQSAPEHLGQRAEPLQHGSR